MGRIFCICIAEAKSTKIKRDDILTQNYKDSAYSMFLHWKINYNRFYVKRMRNDKLDFSKIESEMLVSYTIWVQI